MFPESNALLMCMARRLPRTRSRIDRLRDRIEPPRIRRPARSAAPAAAHRAAPRPPQTPPRRARHPRAATGPHPDTGSEAPPPTSIPAGRPSHRTLPDAPHTQTAPAARRHRAPAHGPAPPGRSGCASPPSSSSKLKTHPPSHTPPQTHRTSHPPQKAPPPAPPPQTLDRSPRPRDPPADTPPPRSPPKERPAPTIYASSRPPNPSQYKTRQPALMLKNLRMRWTMPESDGATLAMSVRLSLCESSRCRMRRRSPISSISSAWVLMIRSNAGLSTT